MGYLNGAMLWAGPYQTFWWEDFWPRTATAVDKTLPLLWPMVDEAGSRDTMGLLLRMAERIKV
jgi:hypothetical protein